MLLAPKRCLLTTESCNTSDLLFCFLIDSELGLPAWSFRASIAHLKNGRSFIFAPRWRHFEGEYTDKWELLRFLHGCWRIGCPFYFYFKYLKCLRLNYVTTIGLWSLSSCSCRGSRDSSPVLFCLSAVLPQRGERNISLKKWFQCHKIIHHQLRSWIVELYWYASFTTSSKYTSVCHRTRNLDS